MRRVSGQWIPSLVLVNVVVVNIGHGIDSVCAAGESFQKCAAPTIRIDPNRIVVADSPNNAAFAGLNFTQMASDLSPEHIAQRHNHLNEWKWKIEIRKSFPNFSKFSTWLTVGLKYFILYNLTRPLTYNPFTASGAIRCGYGSNSISLTSNRRALASHLKLIKSRVYTEITFTCRMLTKLPDN